MEKCDATFVFRCVVADPPWTPSLHAKNPRRATKDKAGATKFLRPARLLKEYEERRLEKQGIVPNGNK